MARSFREARVPNPLKFVADGDAAMAYLQGDGKPSDRQTQKLPLLMLLDLALPGRAGFRLLTWVRKQYWMEDLVVLAITGPKAAVQTRKARSLGANCCLRKPIDFEKLTPILKNLNAQVASK